MSPEIFIRIEYSESDGDLHHQHDLQHTQNDNGYRTICDKIDSDLAFDFGEIVDKKYPEIYDREKANYPSFDQIASEFKAFAISRGI